MKREKRKIVLFSLFFFLLYVCILIKQGEKYANKSGREKNNKKRSKACKKDGWKYREKNNLG
jgi:hypothetical protein